MSRRTFKRMDLAEAFTALDSLNNEVNNDYKKSLNESIEDDVKKSFKDEIDALKELKTEALDEALDEEKEDDKEDEVEGENVDEILLKLNQKEDMEKGLDILIDKDDDVDDSLVVVDANAEDVEHLKKSYVGQYIIQCPVCNEVFFKEGTDLHKCDDEENDEDLDAEEVSELEIDAIYNKGEKCPHCGSEDGFILKGQASSINSEDGQEAKAEYDKAKEEEQAETATEPEEDKESEVKEPEAEEEPKNIEASFENADEKDDTKLESLNESMKMSELEKVFSLAGKLGMTGMSDITNFAKEHNVGEGDLVKALEDEIAKLDKGEQKEMVEEIENFDDEKFNEALKSVNKNFVATDVSKTNNGYIVEGLLDNVQVKLFVESIEANKYSIKSESLNEEYELEANVNNKIFESAGCKLVEKGKVVCPEGYIEAMKEKYPDYSEVTFNDIYKVFKLEKKTDDASTNDVIGWLDSQIGGLTHFLLAYLDEYTDNISQHTVDDIVTHDPIMMKLVKERADKYYNTADIDLGKDIEAVKGINTDEMSDKELVQTVIDKADEEVLPDTLKDLGAEYKDETGEGEPKIPEEGQEGEPAPEPEAEPEKEDDVNVDESLNEEHVVTPDSLVFDNDVATWHNCTIEREKDEDGDWDYKVYDKDGLYKYSSDDATKCIKYINKFDESLNEGCNKEESCCKESEEDVCPECGKEPCECEVGLGQHFINEGGHSEGEDDEHTCCICGEKFYGFGNNASPVADGICCDLCNWDKVIPARLKHINDADFEESLNALGLTESYVEEVWGQTDEDPYQFANEYNLVCSKVADGPGMDDVTYRFEGSTEDLNRAREDGWFYSLENGDPDTKTDLENIPMPDLVTEAEPDEEPIDDVDSLDTEPEEREEPIEQDLVDEHDLEKTPEEKEFDKEEEKSLNEIEDQEIVPNNDDDFNRDDYEKPDVDSLANHVDNYDNDNDDAWWLHLN